MGKQSLLMIFLALLSLGGCAPANPSAAETPTRLSPTATAAATRTRTPSPTQTPIPVTATPDQPALPIEARSAVLIDATTGAVLYDKNARERMYPASITKVMTALLALDYFQPEETLWVGEEVNLAWTRERLSAQRAGLRYSQEATMKELLYGLLLPSGSDAAFTIAVHVAHRANGGEEMEDQEALNHFTQMMNDKAQAIGATDTHFTNPDGFQDPNHFSTAYDLALIALYAMRNALFREIVANPTYHTQDYSTMMGETFSLTWENTNRLIQPQDAAFFTRANGIKTGTTPEAGNCLVSSAGEGESLVIAVVLGDSENGVWRDSTTLLDYGVGQMAVAQP